MEIFKWLFFGKVDLMIELVKILDECLLCYRGITNMPLEQKMPEK